MAKSKKIKTRNRTQSGLTQSEDQVLKIVEKLDKKDKIITSGAIAALWGDKDRVWIYRLLKSLTEKGCIERYRWKFYRIKG